MRVFNKLKKYILPVAVAFSLAGCVHDDDYNAPPINYPDLLTNYSITQLKTDATATSVLFKNDSILEGYVVSSDEGGNIYKNLHVVTSDGKTGIQLNINQGNLYNFYPIGRKVFIKMKGLYYAVQNDMTQIGSEPYGSSTVGQATWGLMREHILLAEAGVSEESLVQKYTSISEAAKNENLNTLVEIDGVQFKSDFLGKTYYDATNVAGGATDNKLEDQSGATMTVRVSQYAKFAKNNVAGGSGKIRGILTKFGDTWQFMIRTIEDVDMKGERFGDDPEPGGLGTKDNPYTIAQVSSHQGENEKWVKGYIVGIVSGISMQTTSQFIGPFTVPTNVLIADSPTETDYTKCVPVQLLYDVTGVNTIRPALNLVTNPGNLGKEVKVYGNLTAYFGNPGIRGASDYVLEGGGTSPGASTLAFTGGDFENFSDFLSGLNSFGLLGVGQQGVGTGKDGGNSLFITGNPVKNDYLFTTKTSAGLPSNPSKIQFYIKGTSVKSFSINVYKQDGSYYIFNVKDLTADKTLTADPANSYTGTINTGGQWVLVTLDLTGISDLNLTDTTSNFLAVKVGIAGNYDIHIDDFIIE